MVIEAKLGEAICAGAKGRGIGGESTNFYIFPGSVSPLPNSRSSSTPPAARSHQQPQSSSSSCCSSAATRFCRLFFSVLLSAHSPPAATALSLIQPPPFQFLKLTYRLKLLPLS